MSTLPIIHVAPYLQAPHSAEALEQCQLAADALIKYGALCVSDERVHEEDNSVFLDLIEDYFAQSQQDLEQDLRPELDYQVGVTLENTERPKCASDESCQALIASLEESQRPLDLAQSQSDPKCRFFHRFGQAPPDNEEFAALNAQNVIPKKFATTWKDKCEVWAQQMLDSVQTIAEMTSVGLGLSRDFFTSRAAYGPHLLAPTATDLEKYGKLNTIFAGFHSDLNALTIHGRSRFPGLHIWARNSGQRIPVKIPPGCLLVQAGKQIEHITGGVILAGYHEVVCSEATVQAIEKAKSDRPDRPLIRISSTFFYHFSSDVLLKPELAGMKDEVKSTVNEQAASAKYPAMQVGALVRRELQHIALMA